MGTCCAACLPAKVRDYAPDAQNGAVTVTIIENPPRPSITLLPSTAPLEGSSEQFIKYFDWIDNVPYCDLCPNRAEFTVSFFPKAISTNVASDDDTDLTG